MTYIEGFVLPVPTDNKDAYIAHVRDAAAMFGSYNIRRMAEHWSDDVPDGTITDFARAVQKTETESLVFCWFEYPDRDTRDAANARMHADPQLKTLAQTSPFDARRMIYGGFDTIVERGTGRGTYIDAFVAAVPSANRQAYQDHANSAAALFIEHGALRVVESWGEDVPDGDVTDFRRAVLARDDETVVYSWIEWPDKDRRNSGWAKLERDDRLTPPETLPFDAQRMIYGGFAALPLD